MPTDPKKPLIVISYAHADEPERLAEGEVKWLSFVTGYLQAGRGGADDDGARCFASAGYGVRATPSARARSAPLMPVL